MIFDSAECRIEIRLGPGGPSLLSMPESFWERMMALAGARIVSGFSTPSCHAFILSQSSLFVFRHKIVAVTCGASGLAASAAQILFRLSSHKVFLLAYSRALGREGRRAAFQDKSALEAIMPGGRWVEMEPRDAMPSAFFLAGPGAAEKPSLGFELVMQDIAPAASADFHPGNGGSVALALDRSGIGGFIEGFTVESRMFHPAGYSLNAVRGEDYFTLHVSPEAGRSYVGIKSSLTEGLEGLTRGVFGHFSPGSATLLTSGGGGAPEGGAQTASFPFWAREAGFEFCVYSPRAAGVAGLDTPA